MISRGYVADGYGPVADAFERNFTDHGDVGAGFCLYADGREVVKLVGGHFSADGDRPYDEQTLQLVFSSTKGATAVCANLLVQRGQLDLDAPVAQYWPEFASAGKEGLPVRYLLTHQAGLPTVDAGLNVGQLLAVKPVVDALAGQEPFWEPGTAHGYHAITYGWLVGEVVRRITGITLGRFFAEEVAGPLGVDFHIGLPEDLEERVSPVITAAPPTDPAVLEAMLAVMGPGTMGWRALTINGEISFGPGESPFNTRGFHATEMPGANGITNASALARMYAACLGDVDGVRLLGDEQVERATVCQTSGVDRCLAVESRFGLGFMLDSALSALPGPRAFGHYGAGGSLGFADPDQGIGFGYVMNQMQTGLADDPRTRGLMEAAKKCR